MMMKKCWFAALSLLLSIEAMAQVGSLISAADTAYGQKNWTEYGRIYLALAAQSPENGEFWYRLGISHRNSGKSAVALEAYGRAFALGYQKAHSALRIASLEAELGNDSAACKGMNVSLATYHRAKKEPVPIHTVRRPRESPLALTEQERAALLDALHAPEHVDATPHTVYAKLLDKGTYLGSVSTMYRLLRSRGEVRKRRNELTHPPYAKPELLATKPREVWSWDITKLKGPVKLAQFHLYVIIDIFSRYVVGWMVADCEMDELAKALIAQTCERQGITADQLTLHADRGASMRSKLVADLLSDLGVTKSHSRPYVSDDNPYSESHFKTMKYRPGFPERFASLQEARQFCQQFFTWYNTDHLHSGLGYVTPEQMHYGTAPDIVKARAKTLQNAFQEHPNRFKNRIPRPPVLPTEAGINMPKASEKDKLADTN